MGVYVPKMKMPEYCLLCPFEHLMTCSREERYTDIHARRRPDWCPLRELDLPDEKDFAEKMRAAEAIAETEDAELSHMEMDRLMCDLIKEIGYGEAVEVFDGAQKWYA